MEYRKEFGFLSSFCSGFALMSYTTGITGTRCPVPAMHQGWMRLMADSTADSVSGLSCRCLETFKTGVWLFLHGYPHTLICMSHGSMQ